MSTQLQQLEVVERGGRDRNGPTANDHIARLRDYILHNRASGPKYALRVVMGAFSQEWHSFCGQLPYFVVSFGIMRSGKVKHWRVTCRALAKRSRKGETHRIEADWINR